MKSENSILNGEVLVTTIPLIADLVIPALLRLQALFPDATVTYRATPELVPLIAGQQHAAIRSGERPDDPALTALPLGMLRFGLFGTMDYATTHGLIEGDLARHRFVVLNTDIPAGPCEEWLAAQTPAPHVLLRTNDETAYLQMIRQGTCAGALPISALAYNPGLIELTPALPEWEVPLWLVVPTPNYELAHLRFAVDLFAEKLALQLPPMPP